MSDSAGAIAFFAFLALIFLVPAWLRNRARIASLKLISEAIAKGQPLDAAMVERLTAPPQKENYFTWFALFCLFLGVCGLTGGVGLALAAPFYTAELEAAGETRASITLATLIMGAAGIGFTVLGIVAWRLSRGAWAGKESVARWFGLFCLFLGTCGLSCGIPLFIAAPLLASQLDPTGHVGAGMMLAAFICAGSGIGFTALGIVSFRLAGGDRDS